MPAAIFNGSAIKLLKDILKFKSGILLITNDPDDPSSVAKSAPQGSIYIRLGAGDIYIKQDSGSSTNWSLVAKASALANMVTNAGTSTDNAIARFDLATGKIIQDSGVLVNDDGTVTLGADATTALQATTLQQVQNLLQGLQWKATARAATTANITLSGPQTIDGVSVIAGDRVLVKNQTATEDNGIYEVAAGAWTRTLDANTAAELNGASIFVNEGTANGDKGFVQTAEIVTLGTDAVVFVQNFGANLYTADGQGLEVSSNIFSLELDGTTLSKSATGLKVADLGITDAQVAAAAAIALTKLAALNNNIVPVTGASGFLTSSAVTATELGYLSGVTSAIQTQFGTKVTGPASVVTEKVAVFDGTTGKLIKETTAVLTAAGALSGLTQLDCDNLQLNGNTLASTDTNGNVVIDPAGTGFIAAESQIRIPEIATPSTPASGYGMLYFKSDGLAYALNDAGSESPLVGQAIINAQYTSNNGQTVTDGNNVIYEDSVYDTNSAYNTGTGVYTVPTTGKYRISAAASGTAHAGTVNTTRFRINAINITSGAVRCGYANIATTTSSVTYNSMVSTTLNCTAGDQLAIRFDISTYTGTLAASGNVNHFSIERVG